MAAFLLLSPCSASAAIYWEHAQLGPVHSLAIGRANLDGSAADPSLISGLSARGSSTGRGSQQLAVGGGRLYWANDRDGAIARANTDGSAVTPNFIAGLPVASALGARGVAVGAGHIYWTNPDGSIGRANLDGGGVDEALVSSADALAGAFIAVDMTHIYWVSGQGIGRANVDGSSPNPHFLGVPTKTDFVAGLAVDGAHLYWLGEGCLRIGCRGYVGRSNLDGSDPHPTTSDGEASSAPFIADVGGGLAAALAVDGSHVYWAQGAGQNPYVNSYILRAKLNGTGVESVLEACNSPEVLGLAVDDAIATTAAAPCEYGNIGEQPRILHLALSARRWCAAPRQRRARRAACARSATLSYVDTEGGVDATRSLFVERAQPGVRHGRHCVAPRARQRLRSRHCTRFVGVAHLVAVDDHNNRIRLSAQLGRRRLAPGRYRLRLEVASMGAGRFRSAVAPFVVVR